MGKVSAKKTQISTLSLVFLLLLGTIFHVIYSWSIFDIYFRSPLVHGMSRLSPGMSSSPAKRLVLFVADGLRADKLFQGNLQHAPFLRSIVQESGSFGVSHTRVPTESRPGHVALIAGFYEDVSAVTKGWKSNPVEFDSVFNASFHTWSFGSPDILPMFADGASPGRVSTQMYPAEFEDFASKDDVSSLDTWVFDKMELQFKEAMTTNSILNETMRNANVIFFLHLLGLDTNGHAYRPYSKEYLDNIESVDKGIRKMVDMIESFYGNDHATSYVFTADHGMSNRGSHGDGNPENTKTPLIAWGAGVAKPEEKTPGEKQNRPPIDEDWGLDRLRRKDVRQADIAPLMSALLGIPYPLNSVGVLPLEFLGSSEEDKTRAIYANALQILEQFVVKERLKRQVELFFKPFGALHDRKLRISDIETFISQGNFIAAQSSCLKLIDDALEGLRYYQTYDWLFLRAIISVGYLGWIAYSSVFIYKSYALSVTIVKIDYLFSEFLENKWISIFSFGIWSCSNLILFLKDSPILYYVYVAFPIFFWTSVCCQSPHVYRSAIGKSADFKLKTIVSPFIVRITLFFAWLEVLVLTYFYRQVLCGCLLLAALGWLHFIPVDVRNSRSGLFRAWTCICALTAIFPVLPVDKGEDIRLVTAGGLIIVLSGVFVIPLLRSIEANIIMFTPKPRKQSVSTSGQSNTSTILFVQLFLIVLSILIVNHTSSQLRAKQGLPLVNQIISWIILATTIIIPILDRSSKGHSFYRTAVVIYFAFAPVFILLSISYEVLFYFSFSVLLFLWSLIERSMYVYETCGSISNNVFEETSWHLDGVDVLRPLQLSDLRIAAFFLTGINLAFFGTGNIASVSSFSLESVYRFTTQFNPFLMAALLILKIMIPFFLLSSAFRMIARLIELPSSSLFLLVLATTDIMTLNFFFLVRDYGSWLEIGTTISHFIIASAFIVFQILLFCASDVLVGQILVPGLKSASKKGK